MNVGWARAGAAASRRQCLVVALAGVLATGCVSVRFDKPTTPASQVGSGSVEVKVFETVADQQRRSPTKRQVRTDLCVAEGSGCRVVHRSFAPGWGVTDLAPGRYRLTAVEWVDAKGAAHRFASPDSLVFDVSQGGRVAIAVIVRSGTQALANTGMTVGAIVACVALEGTPFACH